MSLLIRQEWGLLAESTFLNGGLGSFSLNEAADQIEFIFQAQSAAVISRLGFRMTLRTGTPPTYRISIQGVDGSGRADGTITGPGTLTSIATAVTTTSAHTLLVGDDIKLTSGAQAGESRSVTATPTSTTATIASAFSVDQTAVNYNRLTYKGGVSPAKATFTPPASTAWDATWQWVNLDNSFTVARGDLLSVVIGYASGTVDASNFSNFTITNGVFRSVGGLPYSVTFNATGSAVVRSANLPCFGYGSTTVAYGFPVQLQTNVALNSGTTPDEAACLFTIPAGLANSVGIAGARLYCTVVTAATTHKLILYDTNGTSILQTVTFDSDHIAATTNQSMEIMFTDATLAALVVGNTYRLALLPQTATGITLITFDLAAAADLAAWPGGTAMIYSSRTDALTWTDLATRRPMIVPLLADITGGGPVHPMIVSGQNLPVY